MPQVERMESRRLLSVSLNAATGVVTVAGEPGADAVYAAAHDGLLQVTQNDLTYAFAAASVSKLVVAVDDDAGGWNLVAIAPEVVTPTDIRGGGTGDVLQGGSGPDVITVRGYRSYATGGGGNDTFVVCDGGEITADGGAGNDVVRLKTTDAAGNLLAGGPGYDTVDYSAFAPGIVLRNGPTGRYLPGTAASPELLDPESADQPTGFESFYGGRGNDVILGTAGPNYLRGSAGNDLIRGGGGDDSLDGGPGTDTLYGDDGDDTFFAADGAADRVFGGAGSDAAKTDASDVVDSVERPAA
jgi:Ca2+-binding RTX toxin-like protein